MIQMGNNGHNRLLIALVVKGRHPSLTVHVYTYTQKKKFSQYLCFLIKSTKLHISLSNFIHELYYRSFTCTCSLRDKYCLYQIVSTKFRNARCARAAVNRQGYFLIYCLIMKEICSYCNNPEIIQCYQV